MRSGRRMSRCLPAPFPRRLVVNMWAIQPSLVLYICQEYSLDFIIPFVLSGEVPALGFELYVPLEKM